MPATVSELSSFPQPCRSGSSTPLPQPRSGVGAAGAIPAKTPQQKAASKMKRKEIPSSGSMNRSTSTEWKDTYLHALLPAIVLRVRQRLVDHKADGIKAALGPQAAVDPYDVAQQKGSGASQPFTGRHRLLWNRQVSLCPGGCLPAPSHRAMPCCLPLLSPCALLPHNSVVGRWTVLRNPTLWGSIQPDTPCVWNGCAREEPRCKHAVKSREMVKSSR